MRALVLVAPGRAEVRDVESPRAGPGHVVVEVHRVGVCGTDEELFRGEMAYLHSGRAKYPMRPGHEWAGVVRTVGEGVDASWMGARVTGDTMLGCGSCERCLGGRHHACRDLVEVGVSKGFDGALAELLSVPAASLLRLPDPVDDAAGALVEPGGNAWRAATAVDPGPGRRILVWGAGTIGLLTAAFAVSTGAEVHVVARHPAQRDLARGFGAAGAWDAEDVPSLPFHGIVDATDDPDVPVAALGCVEPAGRVVYIGLAGSPSLIDTRDLVLHDVTAIGILGGSQGLAATIDEYATGRVDPRPLVAATVGLDDVPDVLAGTHPAASGPKVHVDPRIR